ncbi:MAG TPA: acylphosphatase [Capsulimonadaceae bacterium]|nr:acylphosphatase [Capsulimonadaceae bacterium]
MSVKRVQAIVSGRVQGVGYRYFAAHAAHRLGLKGTVRNLPAGEVEAIAEGEEAALEQFLNELRQGPSAANVDDLQAAWGEPSGRFDHFEAIS